MRRLVASALGLLLTVSALAQEETPPAEGSPPAVRAVRLRAKAVDYTATLETSHGGSAPSAAASVVLRETPVTVLVGTGAGSPRSIAAKTDAEGMFEADLGDVPPEAQVQFLVQSEAARPSWPAYYARSWTPSAGEPPAEVKFYRVAENAQGLSQTVMQMVTVEGKEGERRHVRVNQFLIVRNMSFEVWLGELREDRSASVYVPVPEGFTLIGVLVNSQAITPEVEAMPHGGRAWPAGSPIFPTIDVEREQYVFRAILTAPYEEGEVLDLGFHTEFPTDEYRLGLEEPHVSYVPPEDGAGGVVLADGGMNPGINNKRTHAWVAFSIPPHSNVSARFRMGPPPIAMRTVFVTGAILLLVVAAILLGVAFRGRRRDADVAAAVASPASHAATLAELDRQLRGREITSVEYAARRAVLEQSAPTPAAPPMAAEGALVARLDEIARRRGDDDVATLARVVRDLVRKDRSA